jgi:cytidine deaminase
MAEAEKARATAYAPYSKFSVGAALLTRGGRIVHGCNVENASFGLSICAERNAVWKAVSEGERDFVAVAVTAGPDGGASPCGACRQVLQEFAPKIAVYWRDGGGQIAKSTIGELLSKPFVWPKKGAR